MTPWRPVRPDDLYWDQRMFSTPDGVSWSRWGPGTYAPAFKPDFTPEAMTLMGVFGDSYWGGAGGLERFDMLKGLAPSAPQTKGGTLYHNARGANARQVNYHGRPASLSREWWLGKGLICVTDPLGWYEWFWWYDLGRRMPKYDLWQIDRWVSYRARQLAMYRARPMPGTAQALLHWGIRAPHNLGF